MMISNTEAAKASLGVSYSLNQSRCSKHTQGQVVTAQARAGDIRLISVEEFVLAHAVAFERAVQDIGILQVGACGEVGARKR